MQLLLFHYYHTPLVANALSVRIIHIRHLAKQSPGGWKVGLTTNSYDLSFGVA